MGSNTTEQARAKHDELGQLNLEPIVDTPSNAQFWIGIALLVIVLGSATAWVLAR